jgi:BNR repeat-containing family member
MLPKHWLIIGGSFVGLALAIVWFATERHIVIADNGNIIFYNSPAAITLKDQSVAIGYLTNSGAVRVQMMRNGSRDKLYTVHDYAKEVKPVRGSTADDHAAPALFSDTGGEYLYLATAFHNSDLYVYRKPFNSDAWALYRKITGRFTYPRFVETPGGPGFFIRELVKSESTKLLRHLIYFDLASMVPRMIRPASALPDQKRETVYASVPYVHDHKAYFALTLHHGEDRYDGVSVGVSDLTSWSWQEFKITTPFKYASTRPTGIWSDGKTVKVAVSDAKGVNPSVDDMVVLQVDLGSRGEQVLARTADIKTMFYSNSATFNAQGIALASGPNFQYPQYVVGRAAHIYVRNNHQSYSIREFDTSLVLVLPSYLEIARGWLAGNL